MECLIKNDHVMSMMNFQYMADFLWMIANHRKSAFLWRFLIKINSKCDGFWSKCDGFLEKNIFFRSRKKIGSDFFLYSFDVKLNDLSIYEVSRTIPAVLHGFWKLSMSRYRKKRTFAKNLLNVESGWLRFARVLYMYFSFSSRSVHSISLVVPC